MDTGEQHCFHCGRRNPPESAGRCSFCGNSLNVPSPETGPVVLEIDEAPTIKGLPPAPGPLQPVLISSSTDPLPPGKPSNPRSEGVWIACPECDASVHPDDLRCYRCGSDILTRPKDQAPFRFDYEPHRGSLIIWLGRGSLFLGLVSLCGMCFLPLAAASVLAVGSGIGGIAMARDDLALMDRNIMDPAGRGSTRMGHSHAVAGIILAAAGAILSIVIQLPNLMIL